MRRIKFTLPNGLSAMIVGPEDSKVAGIREKHRSLFTRNLSVMDWCFLIVELHGQKIYFAYSTSAFYFPKEEAQQVASELESGHWAVLSDAWILRYKNAAYLWKDPPAAALIYAVKNNVKPSLAVLLAQPTRSRRAK